jgi:cbb3-type cytochrome c oxidase subunit III
VVVRAIAPAERPITAGRSSGVNTMAAHMGQMNASANTKTIGVGRTTFAANCVSCHGDKAQGGFGPDLRNTDLTDENITSTITNGISGKMPAYTSKLSGDKIQALVAYVRSLKK